ncbi:MAG: 30S ribosomal protein S2 [Coriobacteriia bacterium]|jgi:small subunit ribosomal protein S2|nr:30S ribosomal protein S2 [Coriobacteriia bacterium]
MSVVSMKSLLEAGVHFGHQTRRWNPKMKPYIFTERNGIYILDLQRTLRELDTTYSFVRDLAARGESVLFVGTKKQAQEPVASEAERSGSPYVNQRWLGGMLTNFVTMRGRVNRLVELETMEENGIMASLPKKEQLHLGKEREKLERNLSGVREMKSLPGAVFVIDTKRETIAVAEARRLRIPIIGLADTNADPDEIDYIIPANDDAIRSVTLMCRVIADAVIEGRAALEGPRVAEVAERPAPPVAPAPAEEAAPPATAAEPVPEEPASSFETPPAK